MNRDLQGLSKLSVAGAYFFLFVLVFWPLIDLVTNTWPMQPGNIQWRYGFMGLLAGFLNTPILGVLSVMALAWFLGHKGVLRLMSVLSLIASVLLLSVILLFALDVLQLRAATPEDRMSSFQVGALIAELKHLSSFVAVTLLGLGGWRTSSLMVEARTSPSSTPGVVIRPQD